MTEVYADDIYSQRRGRRRWRTCCAEVMLDRHTHLSSICCLFILVLELLEVIAGSNFGLCLRVVCLGRNSDSEKLAMLQLRVEWTSLLVNYRFSVSIRRSPKILCDAFACCVVNS
jgi:hypothetical protein